MPVSSAQEASPPDDAAPPAVFSDRRTIRADMRYRVLRTLETNPELSQRALARELNVSLGALHYCLHALMEKGLVKARRFAASSNKTSYAYILTHAGLAEKTALTRGFLARKRAEYAALQAEIAALEADLQTDAEQPAKAKQG
jgi:EPS-associated MarR family transcriptional regulator